MKHFCTVIAVLLTCFGMSIRAQVNINVNVAQKGIEISPTLYGIFYEDINYASDGGLYAELIRNRSFEFDTEKPEHWKAEGANISLATEGLLNEKQGHALKVEAAQPNAGISNEGYWGINAVAGTQYKLSFWVKPLLGKSGTLKASLQSREGKMLGETLITNKLTKGWQKVSATIVAEASDPQAVFHLQFEKPSTVLLDVVSLFPPTMW